MTTHAEWSVSTPQARILRTKCSLTFLFLSLSLLFLLLAHCVASSPTLPRPFSDPSPTLDQVNAERGPVGLSRGLSFFKAVAAVMDEPDLAPLVEAIPDEVLKAHRAFR